MKTKKQIKLTPLFNSVIQLILIISVIILLVTKIEEIWPIFIAIPVVFVSLLLMAAGLFIGGKCHDEISYGACRYRIIETKVSDHNLYFIQTKPLLPFFFLPWRGEVYSSFSYRKDSEDYICNNAFKTKKDAYNQIEILKNRQEYKKLFFVKKIEICSQD